MRVEYDRLDHVVCHQAFVRVFLDVEVDAVGGQLGEPHILGHAANRFGRPGTGSTDAAVRQSNEGACGRGRCRCGFDHGDVDRSGAIFRNVRGWEQVGADDQAMVVGRVVDERRIQRHRVVQRPLEDAQLVGIVSDKRDNLNGAGGRWRDGRTERASNADGLVVGDRRSPGRVIVDEHSGRNGPVGLVHDVLEHQKRIREDRCDCCRDR